MNTNHQKQSFWAILFLLLALVMCLIGWLTGQAQDVWTKAATICMECIGLG